MTGLVPSPFSLSTGLHSHPRSPKDLPLILLQVIKIGNTTFLPENLIVLYLCLLFYIQKITIPPPTPTLSALVHYGGVHHSGVSIFWSKCTQVTFFVQSLFDATLRKSASLLQRSITPFSMVLKHFSPGPLL